MLHPPTLLLLDIHQHNHKQEENNYGPGVYQHLNRGKEEGIQQYEQPRHRNDRQHKKHSAGHRITAERVRYDHERADQRQQSKDYKE